MLRPSQMSDPERKDPPPAPRADAEDSQADEGGVADSVRAAVERTMKATAGSAATTRERASELVDEVVRRGVEARDELARRGQAAGAGLAKRGQEAGAELARRGQEATGEVSRRLESLEQRLAELERQLAAQGDSPQATPPDPQARVEGEAGTRSQTKPKAEG